MNGESVRLTGNIASLGNFCIEDGVDLVTDDISFPEWISSKPILVPTALPVIYRFDFSLSVSL